MSDTDLEAIAFQSDAQTPLPKVQLALLCLLRTLDSMCFFQIFPYINQFVSDLHVTEDPSKVGFIVVWSWVDLSILFDQANSEIRLHRKARFLSVDCWQFIHGDTSLVSYNSKYIVEQIPVYVDRYGRRPIVLVGVTGLAMSTLLFSLSRDFMVIMLTRAMGNSESFSF